MTTISRIELFKEDFKFSAGHFTIFSQTERENLHGHNFTVQIAFDAEIEGNGMVFDYGGAKDFIRGLCRELNEYFLLPGRSPHLRIEETDEYIYAHFDGEKIPFLKRDIKIMPLQNITLEELAAYFLERFTAEFVDKRRHPIHFAEARVFSAPGQSANAIWRRNNS